MSLARAISLAVAVVAASPVVADDAFHPIGEVQFRASAAYDAAHVRGPNVNMSLTKDGRWGGNLLAKDVLLEVKPDRISGAGVNLVVKRDGGKLSVEGMISGIRVRITATKDSLVGRVGNRQAEVSRRPDGYWQITGGSRSLSTIRFKGDADKVPDAAMPQWVFAVIASV
jgi:hypothetical protein